MADQKIIAVVGPTASGKTALAVELGKHCGGEVVSADSMQIYREMNIGTAKPGAEERQGVAHHLVGHVGVEECYNVASYTADAGRVLADLARRGRLPVVCGGTGLYIDHLLGNTNFFDIAPDGAVREKYMLMAGREGKEAVYALLLERDPELARRLHPHDLKRVVRGLEVLEITGRRLSELQQESHRSSPYDVLWIGLNYRDRQLLYQRIDARVDRMVEQGLLEEVRFLMENYKLSATARAAIGYKELIDALETGGEIGEALELIKQKSRNYAKRQLTWFGKNPAVNWLYRDELSAEEITERAVSMAGEFLKGGNG